MKKALPLVIALAALPGCKSSDGDKKDTAPAIQSRTVVSCVSCTTTVAGTTPFDVVISGSGANITIADNTQIDEMDITGVNNLITIEGCNTNIQFISATGTDNILQYPLACTFTASFDVNSGVGNTIIRY